MVVNAKYLCLVQVDTNLNWNQQSKHHIITVPTRTIIHTQLKGDAITDFHSITAIICSRTQAKKFHLKATYMFD